MSRKRERQPAANPEVLRKDKVPLKLYLGAKIEALEDNNLWYPAKVIGIEESKQRILVHFCGFNSRYDKWYDRQGDSIRPLADKRDKMESTDKDGQQSEVNTSLVHSLLNAPNQPKNVIFSKEEFDETIAEENHQQGTQLDLIQAADGCLTGLSFHFSGNPRNFSIKLQLKTFIKRYNGVYHSFFNKYTKYLIVGHHPKRKVLNEAKRWGTPVVDEDSFFDLVKQSTSQVSFSQQFSKSSGYDNSRFELSAKIKTELMDSPDACDIPHESESVKTRSPTKTGRVLKIATRRKRRKVAAKNVLTNRASLGENNRSGNSDEVVDDCHIPLTPCEAPANNFETSPNGTSLANTSSSSARTALSPGSGVKRRSKAPEVMTDYVLPRKKRKSSQTNKSAANNQLEVSGGKGKPTSLIITTDLTERRIISPETMLNGERPKLTRQKRKYVRKATSQRSSMVNDEKDGPEVVSRKILQSGEDMLVECVFQEEARIQCPAEIVGATEDTSTNPCGNEDASNGHTILSRALSASSGFHSDESCNGNQNSRQTIRRVPDIEEEVSSDSRRMINSMPGRFTTENSERICELEQQSFSGAQSSRSSQNKRVSERSDSMEFDSAGINQTACENNSHQVDINHQSLFVSTPPLSFNPGRSFSITERNMQTNTPSERHPSYVQCPEHCGTILRTEQVESHLKLNCVNAEAECDICGFKMLRKDLQDHISRNAAKHISLMAAEMQAVKNVNKTIVADNVKLRQKLNDMLKKVAVLEERCKAQELLNGL